MSEPYWKQVKFHEWCPKCEHFKKLDKEEPCDECLDHPCIEHSERPMNYKEKKD